MKNAYHASPIANRESIRMHGLDPSRMGPASGIAGSSAPEADGVFLVSRLDEAWWYATMEHVEAVDIWEVDVTGLEVECRDDEYFVHGRIEPSRITLIEKDLRCAEAERRLRRVERLSGDVTGFTGYGRKPPE